MNAGEHADPKNPNLLRTILSFCGVLLLAFLLAWLLREFIIQPYEIPSGSMEDTIMIDDKVFAEKVSYKVTDVAPGDIVTFEDTEIPGRILIKRCVAVGGQTINFVDGSVYVDGTLLSEPYVEGKKTEPLPGAIASISYPYTVPEDTIWVMGDNRTNSKDSRYFGAVDKSSVTGRGVLIYWPLDRIGFLK